MKSFLFLPSIFYLLLRVAISDRSYFPHPHPHRDDHPEEEEDDDHPHEEHHLEYNLIENTDQMNVESTRDSKDILMTTDSENSDSMQTEFNIDLNHKSDGKVQQPGSKRTMN